MNAEKSFQIQQQIRENSDELQAYLKDLENWEKEMKTKEKDLKLINIEETNDIPPVRNSVSRSKRRKTKKQKDKEKSSPTDRISSYNYKAWENFDVESELKKLDEEKVESSSSEDEEDHILQQRKQQAIIKKDKGNDLFKSGMYDAAINCYTSGIELDPDNPLLYANRAMALLKKEQYQAAENDCFACLSLDPTYVKALLRRASARKALNKLSLAGEDYLKILEIEPENRTAQLELEKLKMHPDLDEYPFSNSTFELNNKNNTKNNELPSAQIGNLIINQNNSKNNDSPSSRLGNLMKAIDQNNTESNEPPSTELENLIKEMDQPQPFIVPSSSAGHSSTKLEASSSNSSDISAATVSTSLGDLKEIESVVKQLEQTLPPVPSAAYQFLADWRKLSKYPDLHYQYLKQFPPEKFPVLFKHDMEAEIFCGILKTLSSLFLDNSDDVFPYMKYLTQVGRFHTLLMFLSCQEKMNLRKLMDHLKNTQATLEIEKLLKQYKI